MLFDLAGYFHDPARSRGRTLLVFLIAAWPLTFVGVFFNVALTAAADAALCGRHLGVREALGVSVRRIGQIAIWSLLAAGVGVLLQQVAERVPFGGRIASWVLGAAWSVLTIFAVPVLAIEGCTATDCLRRSAHLLRNRWGESVSGTLTISAWMMLLTVPAAVLLGVGAGLLPFAPVAAVALMLAGVAALMLVSGVANAVRGIFAVALYRYAADGDVRGGFQQTDLDRPFRAKLRRGWGRD